MSSEGEETPTGPSPPPQEDELEVDEYDPKEGLPKDVSSDEKRVLMMVDLEGKGEGLRPTYEGTVKAVVNGEEVEGVIGEWDGVLEDIVRVMRKGQKGVVEDKTEGKEWHVEVTDVSNTPEPYELDIEVKIQYSKVRREKGNEYYCKKDFKNAILKYQTALRYADDRFGLGMNEQALLKQTSEPILTNLAAAHLALKQYHEAVNHLTTAIINNPLCTTARIRRAKAYTGTHDYQLAEEDLAAITPEQIEENPALEKQISEARENLESARAQSLKGEKKTYAKMFK